MSQATGKIQHMHLAILQSKHTTKACLRRFVEEGGISVLHGWLTEAIPSRKSRIIQLLDTFAVLPINLEALKKTQLGKTVKSLSKLNDTEISDKSQKLVSSWLNLLAPEQSTTPNSATPPTEPRKRTLYVLGDRIYSASYLFLI